MTSPLASLCFFLSSRSVVGVLLIDFPGTSLMIVFIISLFLSEFYIVLSVCNFSSTLYIKNLYYSLIYIITNFGQIQANLNNLISFSEYMPIVLINYFDLIFLILHTHVHFSSYEIWLNHCCYRLTGSYCGKVRNKIIAMYGMKML